jgi:hypothetical protein
MRFDQLDADRGNGFGPQARAVVVVSDTVSDAELKRRHRQGARGIRFNLAQPGATTTGLAAGGKEIRTLGPRTAGLEGRGA